MAKKKFFTGPEMEALSGPLDAAQTALAVTSFRLAARVANAAWTFVESLKPGVSLVDRLPADQALRDALHAYSPENLKASEMSRKYAAMRLEELYEVAEKLPTREAVLEAIYAFACEEHE